MLKQRIKVSLNECDKRDLFILGEEIKKMRKANGYSQQELSEMMLRERSGLSKIEGGQITPTLQTLSEIAKTLGYNLSITFEKEITNETEAEEVLRNIYMTDDREMLENLTGSLDTYNDKIELISKDKGEEFYYKNRVNYEFYTNLTNDLYAEKLNEVHIYLDNPSECHLFTSEYWDSSIYIRVTTSTKEQKIYSMELIKEDDCGFRKNVLYTFTANTPLDVIIAAENIRKCFLEGDDVSSTDITNMNVLRCELDKEVKIQELSEILEYVRVIDQIEAYNEDTDTQYGINYNFKKGKGTDGGFLSLTIKYKGKSWSCSPSHGCYEVTLEKTECYDLNYGSTEYGSTMKEIKLLAEKPKEVVDIILQHS